MVTRAKKVAISVAQLEQSGYWQHWVSQGGNAPLLLSSSSDSTLQQKVLELAQTVFCEKTAAGKATPKPCAACRSCRLVAAGNHPDVIRKVTDKATWTIKNIRQLFSELTLTSTSGRRLVIIEEIEKASLPAANALLKSLEEPRPSTSFILTTKWPRRLLPTIRSRCYQVALTHVSAPAATLPLSALRKLKPEELTADVLASLVQHLERRFRADGPTPQLRRAYGRLRDYYFISSKRGNTKLAADVLLLSLPPADGMS